MTNRLLQLLRTATLPLAIGLLLLLSFPLKAQFTFTYPGPNTIAVGPTCSASLSGNIGTPIVTPPPGNTVTVSMFDAAASGFNFTDLWPAPSTVIVHWHVEDNMGNMQNFTFSVNFADLTPPVFDLTGVPSTLNVNSVVQVPPPPVLPVTDNCTSVAQIVDSFFQTPPPDTCASGVYTRTWRATDLAGNTATFTQTINVFKDTLPPTVSVFPQNGSAPCDQLSTAYPAWLATQMANFTASDPSGIKIKTNNAPASFPPGCAVPLTVTFRAIDNCNLIFPTTAVFSTSDNTPPAILVAAKDTIAYCSPGGNHLTALGKWINKHGYQQSADACSDNSYLVHTMRIANVPRDSAQVVAAFLASYANGCNTQTIGNQTYNKVRGKVTVQFYVQDACGNNTMADTASFGAIDTLPPVVNGVNVSEQCGNGDDQPMLNTWINAHGNATVTDDCSATSWTNFSWTTSAGQSGNGVFNTGPYPVIPAHNCTWFVDVTFRASDECGNIGSKVLRFQILDTQKPIIADYPDTVTLYCPNPMPTLSPVFVSDNCDTSMVITYTAVQMDSLCDGSYTMRVTWSATDDCHNTGTAIQTVLVRDTIGPVFTLVPGPKTFRCDTFVLPAVPIMGINITATDNCSPVLSITTQTVSGQNPDPAVCGHYTYDITRIFTASDECGNTRTATQVISVIDSLGPVISIQDTTVVCDAPPMTPPATASDVCGSPVAAPTILNQVFMPGNCSEEGISTLTWKAVDVCNNTSTKTQQIFIIDTVAPVLTGIPADITVECDAIPAPPANNTFTATDNCAANVSISFNESEIRNPDPLDCAHWTNYLIRREWTASDHCGNTRRYTQTLSVQDNTGPVMVPPGPITLPADNGVCGANTLIPPLQSLYDQCTSQPANVNLNATALMVSTTGSQTVDTIVFQWATPNLPPGKPVVGPASLSLFFNKVDMDLVTEYFNIYGENGVFLAKTDTIYPQCNSETQLYTISASNLNSWMSDGNLVLKLAPSAGVNPVCAGGKVVATLTYKYNQQEVPISLSYMLDNNPLAAYPPSGSTFLESGIHTIVYTATDCAGNSSTTSVTVTIQDLQPPVVTPPAPFTAYVGQDSCTVSVALPFPNIFENCDVSGSLSQASGMLPIQFHLDDDVNGYIPNDISMNISGLVPNAITNGRLIIRHRGDNANTGEFFNIFDENNTPYPATMYGSPAEECTDFHETFYNISAANINSWAGNGSATFKAVANNDVLNFSDFINPCGTLLPDLSDGGQSRIQAVLEYSFAVVTYEVRKNANLLFSGSLNGSQTTVSLTPGVYQVKYIVADINGLEGSATYNITVLDTVKPKAMCLPVTINTNPSGLPGDVYVLQPAQINNNSSDNCTGPLTYQLSQQNFPCNLATPPNNIYPITLTVTDAYGNSSSCTTTVQVLTQSFNPTYDPVCEGGVLHLYANAPGGYGPSVYSFKWTNPSNAVFSMAQNPVDLNAQPVDEGLYSVTVTGLSGCTAVGLVTVDLANLPFTPILTANNPPVCFGDSIKLTTATYNGQNLSYHWYSGYQGNSTLITTTPSPQLVIPNPAVGNYQYYVVVAADGCTSVSSQPITVIVNARPTAQISPDSINVCSGQQIVLASPSQGPGMTYQWCGPNGFMPTVQNPPAIPSATSADAGIYCLVVTQNGCMSTPATAKVIVRPTPPKPQIQPDSSKVCEFTTIQLTANVLGASMYVWQGPTPPPDTTFTNTITLPNLLVSNAGNWRVRAVLNGCVSPFSNAHPVLVQAYPDVTANPALTVCEGDTVKLTANANVTLPFWCWTGNNFVTYTQNPKIYPAIPGTYTYKVVGKTSFGCADSTTVFVNVVQRPVIASISNNAPICADGTSGAVLKALIQSPNGPFMYTWTGPPAFGTSTDSMPVIAPVSTNYNGPYTLIVKDIYGCKSNPATTTIHTNPPLLTPSMSIVPTAVCAGGNATITVSGQYPTSATYKWTRPNAPDTITTGASLTILNAQQPDSGMYLVQVLTDTCSSPSSGPVNFQVKPIPAIPIPTADSPICVGETLHFDILNPQMGAVYTWSTDAAIPFPPPATGQSPTIPNVGIGNAGNYYVSVNLNGCTAGPGEPKVVVVKPLPKTPNLFSTSGNNVCRDYPGAKIGLQIGIGSITQNAMYSWYWIAPGGDVLISGPALSTGIEITDLSPFPSGANMFKVIGNLNGCSSPVSNITTVNLDTIPDIVPFAGGDSVIYCTTVLPLSLNADPVLVGSGKWTQTGGPNVSINASGNPKSIVSGITPWNIYQFVWTLSNGSCTNYASDTTNIRTVAFEQAMVVQSLLKECSVKFVEINAIQGQHVNGYWGQANTQADAGVTISNPGNPTTIVDSLLISNQNVFYWNLPDIGCGASQAPVMVWNYSPKPYAGPDQTICVTDSCANLSATMLQPSFETGLWSSNDTTLKFGATGSSSTSVCRLKPGLNTIYWTTNDNYCDNQSRDTLVIFYELQPTANPDMIEVGYGQQVHFDVIANDILSQNFSINLSGTPPPHGSLDLDNSGMITYQADAGFSGADMFNYIICNNLCPTPACSATTVTFNINEPGACLIPRLFTPNGDRVNDVFVVPGTCLGEGGTIEVTIFNQWGDQVFHADPYGNDWDGTYNGDPLPAGTYFSVVKFSTVETPVAQFLILQR